MATLRPGRPAQVPAVIALVAVTAVAAAAAAAVTTVRAGELRSSWPLLTSTSVMAVVGALLVARRPHHPVGWWLLATGVPFLLGLCAEGIAASGLAHPPLSTTAEDALWVANWIYPPALVPLFVLVPLTFPAGRLPSVRWRGLALFAAGLMVVLAVFGAFGQPTLVLNGTQLPNPHAVTPLATMATDVMTAAGLAVVGCSVAATVSLVVRWRRAASPAQQQIMWVVLALVVLAAALALDSTVALLAPSLYPTVFPLVQLAPVTVPLAIAVAVLNHQLFDIEALVSRLLVYFVLTVVLVAGYALAVAGVATVLPGAGTAAPRLLATAAVAVAFAPLRDALQRLMARRFFGERDRPYVAMTDLERQLQRPSPPEQVLETLVASTAHALRSPYVAIDLHDQPHPAAEHGARPADTTSLAPVELTYAGVPLGRLLVSARGPEALSPADLRLMADLALPIGAAVHAVRLSNDLRHSRERMVLSREEERRRMGRDLHDDLGPQLAAISMQVETVRDVVLTDPERAHSLLGELLDQAEKAVHETRRVAHAHRPPGLDAVGLVPALESHLAQVTALPTRFDVPQRLPDLPAAVEAAAYRIAVEAVQNVAAHARARSCSVRLTHTRQELILEVADDGIGMAPNHSIGLGLDSMTERAAELGGRLTVEAGAEEIGTVVRAVLPCRGTDVTRLASRGAPPGRTEGKAHPDEHAERADLRRPRRVSSQPVGADQRR